MAKSESTAVNELINLVQGGAPSRAEPSDDLFGPPSGRVAPPRMTSTVPPLRGAGEVAPLPPQRAPIGTSQMVVNKQVRMTTAPPTRTTTIPPLPQARASSPGASKVPPPHRASTPRASSPDLAARTAQPASARPAPPPRPAPVSDNHAALPRPNGAPAALPPLEVRARDAQVPARSSGARGTGSQRTAPPTTTPVAAPFDAADRAAIDKTGDAISADNWFEASRMVDKVDETWVGTRTAPKRAATGETLKKILLPLVVLSVVSAGVAYVVFSHHGKKAASRGTHVTAPAATSAPGPATSDVPSRETANTATATAGGTQPEAPGPATEDQVAAHPNANDVKIVASGSSESPPEVAAPPAKIAEAAPVAPAKVAAIAEAAPVVHEVPTANGVVKLVDVRIDSRPAGATVMLVDNGKTSFLGTTPVAASVDPTRSYDVVLTLEGRPTQMAHLDPNKAQKLEITLSKTAARAETPKAAPVRRRHVAASGPTGGLVDPGFDAPAAPKAAAGGKGTLMVSTKPPCEIWIDGSDTGRTTPQRSMSLPAGSHEVTFVNASEHITKTVSVKITAAQPTKLIQNLMPN